MTSTTTIDEQSICKQFYLNRVKKIEIHVRKIRTLSAEDTVLSRLTSASSSCHKNGILGSRFKVQGSSVFFCHFEQSEKSEYVHRRGNPLWLPDSSLRCVACVGTHKGIPECNVRHISGQTHRSAPTVRRDLTNIV